MLASDHPSTDGIVELSQLVQAVLTATGRCATLRKLSLNRRRRFSHDFALIAASVRLVEYLRPTAPVQVSKYPPADARTYSMPSLLAIK